MTETETHDARQLASEWHSGQSSALYAFSSSGHIDTSTEIELERVESELEHRCADHAYSVRMGMRFPGIELEAVRHALRVVRAYLAEHPDTSEDRSTDHGFDACPDCGNVGVKMTAAGYVPCTRFLTCWADVDDATGDVNPSHDH